MSRNHALIEEHIRWMSRQFAAINDGLALNVGSHGVLDGNCLDTWVREHKALCTGLPAYTRLNDALGKLRRCVDLADCLRSSGNEDTAYRLLDQQGSWLSHELIDAFLDLQNSLEGGAKEPSIH